MITHIKLKDAVCFLAVGPEGRRQKWFLLWCHVLLGASECKLCAGTRLKAVLL